MFPFTTHFLIITPPVSREIVTSIILVGKYGYDYSYFNLNPSWESLPVNIVCVHVYRKGCVTMLFFCKSIQKIIMVGCVNLELCPFPINSIKEPDTNSSENTSTNALHICLPYHDGCVGSLHSRLIQMDFASQQPTRIDAYH